MEFVDTMCVFDIKLDAHCKTFLFGWTDVDQTKFWNGIDVRLNSLFLHSLPPRAPQQETKKKSGAQTHRHTDTLTTTTTLINNSSNNNDDDVM